MRNNMHLTCANHDHGSNSVNSQVTAMIK
jgi:hypothetical protein